jgi:hypothetical protein
LVNGRVELPDEIGSAAAGLPSYLANRSGAFTRRAKVYRRASWTPSGR